MGEKKASDAKIRANARYNLKAYDVLTLRVRKSEHINQRIDKAIEGTGISKAQYVLDAVKYRLEADNVPEMFDDE